jgi:SAM-dependent MidA family methyltransferase
MDERVGAVRGRVVAEIAERGTISFADYMEIALYAPGGFYDAPPVGPEGHFVTSPHAHPVFAELLSRGLRELWELLGSPQPFRVVEVGAGDGTLARRLLDHLADLPVAYTAVERSTGARSELSGVPGISVASELREQEPLQGVVLANELLDNLPFRRVRGTAAGPVEVRVGLEDSRLVEVETPCDDELARLAGSVGRSDERAVPVGAFRFVEDLANVLDDGFALLIDYEGGTNDLHGYRGQRAVEVDLDRPGVFDITAGVDLTAVAARAAQAGLSDLPPVSQSDALRELGFERWLLDERERQASLLTTGAGVDAVRTWSGRNAALSLVDPAGLGRLRWLTLASSGRPGPRWVGSRT